MSAWGSSWLASWGNVWGMLTSTPDVPGGCYAGDTAAARAVLAEQRQISIADSLSPRGVTVSAFTDISISETSASAATGDSKA